MESCEAEEHLVDDYVSLARLYGVDSKTKQITVEPGNYFDKIKDHISKRRFVKHGTHFNISSTSCYWTLFASG